MNMTPTQRVNTNSQAANATLAACEPVTRITLGVNGSNAMLQGWECKRSSPVSRITLLVGAFALACGVAPAADFPTRTISIIVPFAAGGGNDVQARLLAKGLSERLRSSVIVENRPGAGGHIAAELASRAKPDGHTLLFSSTGSLVFGSVIRNENPLDYFVPITAITQMPLVLVPSPTLPVTNVAELIALARRKPGELTYSSAGAGSFLHLATEIFKAQTKTDIVHVPYKGEAAAIVDVVGGRISMSFMTAPFAIPQVRAGKLKPLAVTGTRRVPALPEVPTFDQAGVAGMDAPTLWFGLAAPNGTPKETIEHLNSQVLAVVKVPEFSRSLEEQGIFVLGEPPAQFTRRVQADVVSISKLVKAIDLRLEE
jgi:tripartite-type tricarboxylate transporter receptor subunit TctC